MGGGKQRRHRAALEQGEHGGTFGAGGRHHGEDVVHLLLERRCLGDGVRQAAAAAIEHDQTAEAGQPVEVARQARLLPVMLDLGDPARHVEQSMGPSPTVW